MVKMELECLRCGHHWIRRDLNTEPGTCPYCKSPYWNKERVRPMNGKRVAKTLKPQAYRAKRKRTEAAVPAFTEG